MPKRIPVPNPPRPIGWIKNEKPPESKPAPSVAVTPPPEHPKPSEAH